MRQHCKREVDPISWLNHIFQTPGDWRYKIVKSYIGDEKQTIGMK